MRKKLQILLASLAADLPGFASAAVVTVDDGLSVAELSSDPRKETAAAAAYLASIVKSNTRAIKLLAESQRTEDILVSTDQFYYLIREVPGYPFFVFLMIRRGEWLGMARMLLKEFEPLVVEILTAYLTPVDGTDDVDTELSPD
jgi:predicted regulator of Ras-like GTPase activity (Roadblock/LC7/MglB family)